MVRNKSLKLNFIMNAILTISQFIFPLITFPYVSKILLPLGTGKVSFATSIVSYFAMFAQMGIPMYGVRACAKVRDNKKELSKTVHELFFLNIVMSIISYAIFLLMLFLVPRLKEEKLLFLIVSSTIWFNSIGIEWLYKALEQYTYITVRSVFFKFIALIAMFILVHRQEDYIIYGAISIFASSASCIFNFINAKKYISFEYIGGYNFKIHLKAICVFFAMSCATTIYTHLDTVMLGFMKDDIEVGYYNAAVRIKSILVSIVTSLGVVLLPRASYYIKKGMMSEFYRITQKAINFVFIIATPMMCYFMLFAREGIYFLSSSSYKNSILPMQLLMPTLLFIGLTNIMGIQMLVPLGKEKLVLYSEIAGLIANVTINMLLIPTMEAVGAAIGTLVAEGIVLLVQFIALKDVVIEFYKKVRYLIIFIAIFFAGVSAWGIKSIQMNLFGILLLSSLVFFGVYFGILTILKEAQVIEIEKQVLSKIRQIYKKVFKSSK